MPTAKKHIIYYEAFRPLFSFGAHVTTAAGNWGDKTPDLKAVANDLDLLVTTTIAASRPIDKTNFDLAWFPVCAWLDEKLAWVFSSQHEVKYELLQRKYFDTLNAGEEFFDKLEAQIEKVKNGDKDMASLGILSVFSQCLELGFRGKFFLPEDQPALEALKMRCYEALLSAAPELREFGVLFKPSDAKIQKPASSVGMFWFWAVPVGVTVFLYLFYKMILVDLYAFMTQ